MFLESRLTQDILDSLEEGVMTVDKDFRIMFFNRAAEKITGQDRQAVIGKFCKHIFRSDNCMAACPIARVLTTGNPIFDFQTSICKAAGDKINVKINSAVLYNNEQDPIGGIVSFRDLSTMELWREKQKAHSLFHGMVGHSRNMQEIFQLVQEIADTDATVFIQGESGTGKEMIANAIQHLSHRRDHPFIKVNCSVFPLQLLASELFGHVKGAFTGAIRDRVGRFEAADRGTLFLDEVAEMPLEMQPQLLRVLQEGSFERVGDSVTHRVNVRIIAATNKDLHQAMQNRAFREDLYYRLNVIPIHVPPLRERIEDIPYLIRHFIEKFSLLYPSPIEDVDDETLDLFISHSWPGNIRELENAIEYAFARTKDDHFIRKAKLPPHFRPLVLESRPIVPFTPNESLLQVLERHRWNRTEAARSLGIGRTTLWRRMKNSSLDHPA
jgi:PAS domain S-box-containing protein